MEYITYAMVVFAVLGGLDLLFGNRFGLGKEFERGFEMLGTLALCMLGLLTLAPFLADLMEPGLRWLAEILPFDPSLYTSFLFANDNGGAVLAENVAIHAELGAFNGHIVASMLGATVSFTIPFALSNVPKQLHRNLLLGLLCGIVTIPLGCFAGGLIEQLPMGLLLLDLLPIFIVSGLIALGLFLVPELCLKIFKGIGFAIKGMIVFGLILGVVDATTGLQPLPGIAPFSENAEIILFAATVMSGAFPMIYVLQKILTKPLGKIARKTGMNEVSAAGFLTTVATSVATFDQMKKMDGKGILLNSAFAVSAAFLLTDHLAFTVAKNPDILPGLMVGKVVAALFSLAVAWLVEKKERKTN